MELDSRAESDTEGGEAPPHHTVAHNVHYAIHNFLFFKKSNPTPYTLHPTWRQPHPAGNPGAN